MRTLGSPGVYCYIRYATGRRALRVLCLLLLLRAREKPLRIHDLGLLLRYVLRLEPRR